MLSDPMKPASAPSPPRQFVRSRTLWLTATAGSSATVALVAAVSLLDPWVVELGTATPAWHLKALVAAYFGAVTAWCLWCARRRPRRWQSFLLLAMLAVGIYGTVELLRMRQRNLTELYRERLSEARNPAVETGAPRAALDPLGRIRESGRPELPAAPSLAPFARQRFAFLGDSGNGNENVRALVRMIVEEHRRAPLDAVFLLGDNIYLNAVGELDDPYAAAITEPLAPLREAGIPVHAILGNHDYDDPRHARRQLIDPLLNMDGQLYRTESFASGAVEFFLLDAALAENDELQSFWLRRELDRSPAEWKFILVHNPALSSLGPSPWVEALLRGARIADRGVQAVFSGDNHNYERLDSPEGFVQVVAGGGSDVDDNAMPPHPHREAAYTKSEFYVLLEVMPDEALLTVRNVRGEIRDHAMISREGKSVEVAGGE